MKGFALKPTRNTVFSRFIYAVLLLCFFSGPGAVVTAQEMLGSTASMVEVEQVNINRADAEAIAEALNGIGLSRAQAIVEYREKNGSFSSLEELLLVRGIGKATLAKNEDRIAFV